MKIKRTLTVIIRVTSVIIVLTTSTLTRLMWIEMALGMSVTTVKKSEFKINVSHASHNEHLLWLEVNDCLHVQYNVGH